MSKSYRAHLIDADGKVRRSWDTDDPDYAQTADRNCPLGWSVAIEKYNQSVMDRVE